MAIKLSVPSTKELKPRIAVFGVGGAGGNAVNNMIGSALAGVEFVVANTDAQALSCSLAERKIQLGVGETAGLGAGSRPEVGRAAAEEALDQIADQLQGCHMVFVTAGMGGGTGTGAAPVIARVARDLGILTVGVVTKPFQFEGGQRMRIADAGIEEMQRFVDTLLIIPNQNLFRVANEKTTFAEAFKMADNVLYSGVRGVTDLMVIPGLINLDFADVKAVMGQMGKAMMGTGESDGEGRALDAAEKAIANPLLDDVSMKGARGVLINITGGPDLTLFEVDEAANRIRKEVDTEANIIVGSALAEEMAGKIRVSVVATGIDVEVMREPRPAATVTPLVRPTANRGQQGHAHSGVIRAPASTMYTPGMSPVASGQANVRSDSRGVPNAAPQAGLRTQVQARLQPEEDLKPAYAPPQRSPAQTPSPAPAAPRAHAPHPGGLRPERVAPPVVEPRQGELPVISQAAPMADPARAQTAPEALTGAREQFIPPRPQEVDRGHSFIRQRETEARSRPSFLRRIADMALGHHDPEPAVAPVEVKKQAPAPVRAQAPAQPKIERRVEQRFESRIESKIEQKAEPKMEAAVEPTPAPAPEPARVEAERPMAPPPVLAQPTPEPVRQPAPEPAPEPEAASGGRIDEDLLDIPAFLRRQAN